jgi:hypothetical protein
MQPVRYAKKQKRRWQYGKNRKLEKRSEVKIALPGLIRPKIPEAFFKWG